MKKDLRCRLPYSNQTEKAQLQHFINLLKDRIHQQGVSSALNSLQPQYSQSEKAVIDESKTNLKLELDGTPIHTLEQLIQACDIDTTIWEVLSFRTSTWVQKEGGEQLYSIRANFKRTQHQTILQFLDDLKTGLYDYAAPKTVVRKTKALDYCGIINIYDAHIDKMTVLSETGTESDIYKNVETFERHFDKLLDYLAAPEVIIFPIGNDFFNVNDSRNTTKKGTHQPSYLHFVDAFKIGLNLIRKCIDKARLLAPVYVPVVQGNHDEDLATLLGAALYIIYEGCSDVHIDDSRLQRKYKQYGANMFMFDHGDKVKIDRVPMIMAQEERNMWASTKYRYNFRGHCHHSQEYKITSVKETVGVEVHHLRALSQPSAWNVAAGWIGAQKATTAYKISRCGRQVEKKILSL